MKKIIYILIIGFIHTGCTAQTRLIPGEIKGKHDTFIIHLLKPMSIDTQKLLGISSKSNKYSKGIPYSKQEKSRNFIPMNLSRDIHVNSDAVNQIVYQVLNKKLNAIKSNKEIIYVELTFHPDGKLTDVGFTLHENTLISLQDIEEIDRQLRANIKATFTGKEYLQYEAINAKMISVPL